MSVGTKDIEVTPRWRGNTLAVITENAITRDSIESYVRHYGAETFIPIVPPFTTHDLQEMLRREQVACLFVDENMLNTKYSELCLPIVNDASVSNCKLIQLIQDNNLSVNSYESEMSSLSINPLQPGALVRIVDLYLGLEKENSTDEAIPGKKTTHSIKLLVVDDDPTNRELVSRQLDYLGHEYEVMENGEEALEVWQRGGFDGIVTDCHMPVMDGYEFAKQIRRLGESNIPIIAMTANTMTREKKRCLASGMTDFLAKPILLIDLKIILSKWFHVEDRPVSNVASGDVDDVFATLRQFYPDGGNMYKMLESFWNATEDDIEELEQAISDQDKARCRDVAHRIKGASQIMLAKELTKICQTIEATYDEMDVDALKEAKKQLVQSLAEHKEHFVAQKV